MTGIFAMPFIALLLHSCLHPDYSVSSSPVPAATHPHAPVCEDSAVEYKHLFVVDLAKCTDRRDESRWNVNDVDRANEIDCLVIVSGIGRVNGDGTSPCLLDVRGRKVVEIVLVPVGLEMLMDVHVGVVIL